jgi:predicted nuclease with TOPRIM domain
MNHFGDLIMTDYKDCSKEDLIEQIKNQKKLNKELLTKQADLEQSEIHLKEVNQTKNKLF